MVIGGFWCVCHYTNFPIVRQYKCYQHCARPVKHELTKHIGVDASFVRTAMQDQIPALHYVPSKL
jgi:hypothetical protein